MAIRNIDLSKEDKDFIKAFNLITSKPIIYVANVNEDIISKDNDYIKNLKESVKNEGFELIKISASIEEQISQMEEEDQNIFLNEYGLKPISPPAPSSSILELLWSARSRRYS